jgi:hypothetical protein
MSDFSDAPSTPTALAPWDEPENQDTPEAPEAEEPRPDRGSLNYKLGLLEGAVEVAVHRLNQTDEDEIADGLEEVLNRVRGKESEDEDE